MKFLMMIMLFVSTAAFANLENFQGRYEAVSGQDGTMGCIDFDIVYDSKRAKLDVIEAGGNYEVWEIPAINKGIVAFENDWGDGVTKGYQVNTYDGKFKVVHEVRVLFGTRLYRKLILTFAEDGLKIERKTGNNKVCVLKKI